jgi:hypothetical protein
LFTMGKFDEVFGWYGFVAILGAYAAVAFYPSIAGTFIYKLLNVTGAIGLAIISSRKKVWQPAALNTIWALFAFISFFR